MRKIFGALAATVLVAGLGSAVYWVRAQAQSPSQTSPVTATAPKRTAPAGRAGTAQSRPTAVFSVDGVIQLVHAGLSEDVVITRIRKNGRAFDLSTEQLVQLKKAGVGDAVIKAMLAPDAPTTPAPPTTIAAGGGLVVSPRPTPPLAPAAAPEPRSSAPVFNDEPGVYWARAGRELIRVEGIGVSNVRTGSTLASALTLHIKRARVNAQVRGARSVNRIPERQPQFYFALAPDASIGDFILLKVAQRSDVRQFEISQRTFWKNQIGVDHDKEIEFTYRRLRSRLYLVTPNRELEPGEYVFYTSAGISSIELKKESARIYDFGIDR